MEEDEPTSSLDQAGTGSSEHSINSRINECSHYGSQDRRTLSEESQQEVYKRPSTPTEASSSSNASLTGLEPSSASAPSSTDSSHTSSLISPVSIKTSPIPATPHQNRLRTGIPTLDREMSSDIEDEEDAQDNESDDGDGWNLVKKPRADLADFNGMRGSTLFSRGVVDRYRFGLIKRNQPNRGDLSTESGSSTPSNPAPSALKANSKTLSSIGSAGSSRRGLDFRVGKFSRRRPLSASEAPSTAQSSPNRPTTFASVSLSPSDSTNPGYSLPSSLGGTPSSLVSCPQTPRSSFASPTKNRVASNNGSSYEDSDSGAISPIKITGGEKFKKFSRSGSGKVMGLFSKN